MSTVTAQMMKRLGTMLVAASLCAVTSSCTTVYGGGLTNASVVSGPLTVDGPLTVLGSLAVEGPADIHGSVSAHRLEVSGPVETAFPKTERPGLAGQTTSGNLAIAGPLTVNGPLTVDGTLKVAGPLRTEVDQGNESLQETE